MCIRDSLEVVADPTLPLEIRQELEIYVDAAQIHLADPTGDMTLEEVAGSFERLSNALATERSALIEELEDVNSRMNSVAAIAGFAIAFLVPATGLYVWEALRRGTGRQRSLERQMVELQAESLSASGELVSSVAGLRQRSVKLLDSLGSSEPAAARQESEELAQAVEQLHRELTTGDLLETVVRQPTRLVDMVRRSVSTAMVPTLSLPPRSELSPDIVVVIDADKMSSALTDLIQMTAGASTTIRLNVAVRDAVATVVLEHNDTPTDHSLSESDWAHIGQQMESAGASLSFEPGPVVSTYSLNMPLSTAEGLETPTASHVEQIHR